MQNRLFDSILRTSGADTDDIHSGEAEGNFWATGCEIGQIFESVLREADEENQPVENEKTEGLIYIEDLVKMTKVLTTKKPEIITHNSLGDIVLYAGEANKSSFGLKHIIFSRITDRNYNKTEDETTAILALICSALHDGKVESNYQGVKIVKNYITAIAKKWTTRKGDELILLTGFDINDKQKEATGVIQTVIAQYNSAPEYSSIRNQVVAVASNI